MSYQKFQKFCHFLSTLFNILFWIMLISAIISVAGFIYVIVNYDNLPNLVKELEILTPDELTEVLKFSKGYLIMCLVDFIMSSGLTLWLYKTIVNSAKNFEKSDCVFTLENYKNIKNLTKVFYCLALGSVAVVVLAGATLNETEALDFVLDETSLCLGLVFTFICFLFKQTARPVIRTIEIKDQVENSERDNNQEQVNEETEKDGKQKLAKDQKQESKEIKPPKRKTTTNKNDNKDN